MARTKIPADVRNNLVNRLSVFMLTAANGSDTARDRVRTVTWTLGTVGLENELITGIMTEAAANADLPPETINEYTATGAAVRAATVDAAVRAATVDAAAEPEPEPTPGPAAKK